MSVRLIARVWQLPSTVAGVKIRGAHIAVLAALADHCNEDGVAWPAQRTLAQKTHFTRQTVNSVLADCLRAGLIEIEHQTNERGIETVARYKLHLPAETSPVVVVLEQQERPELVFSEFGQALKREDQPKAGEDGLLGLDDLVGHRAARSRSPVQCRKPLPQIPYRIRRDCLNHCLHDLSTGEGLIWW